MGQQLTCTRRSGSSSPSRLGWTGLPHDMMVTLADNYDIHTLADLEQRAPRFARKLDAKHRPSNYGRLDDKEDDDDCH